MKPFQCTYCAYSSNYKHDLKRHLKRHGIDSDNVSQFQQPFQQQIPEMQKINTQSPYLNQAINFSNSISVPPQQIINIQPPQNFRKPIFYDNQEEFYDIRLKENFKMFVSGPSRSGKTFFIKDLLKNVNIFSKQPPQITIMVYQIFQDVYRDMGVDYLIQDCPNITDKIFEISNGYPTLVIFDDFLKSGALADVANLFIVDGRHRNLSMVFIGQNLFVNDENFRLISQNSDYFVLFKNPRSVQQIRTLAAQMSPKMELMTHYSKATMDPFSYLFINLTQECKPPVKYLSHLFNELHVVKAYGSKASHLVDEGLTASTNFSRMKFKSLSSPSHAPPPPTPSQPPPHPPPPPPSYASPPTPSQPPHQFHAPPPAPPPPPIGQKDVSIGTNSMLDQGTNPMLVHTQSRGVGGPEMKDHFTNTYPVNMKNASSGNVYRDQGAQMDFVTMKDIGVGNTETIHKSTNTVPVFMKDASVGSMYKTHGTQMLPVNTEDIGVGMDEKIHKFSNTIPIETRNEAVGGYERRNEGTQIVPMHIGDDESSNDESSNEESSNDASDQDYDDDGSGDKSPYDIRKEYRDYRKEYRRLYEKKKDPINDVTVYLDYRKYLEKPKKMFSPKDVRRFDRGERDLRLNSDVNREPRRIVDGNGDFFMNHHSCNNCDELFDTARALNRHERSCNLTVFACTVCGKNLPTRRALSSHKKAMHQTRKQIREY